jgi:hypothetical protein
LSLDGREYNIACGQIDIGNAATTTTRPRRGRLQATGRTEAERAWMSSTWRGASSTPLPLEANVQFMTVMATKMPYRPRLRSSRPCATAL